MRCDYKETDKLNIAEEESAENHEPSDTKVQMGRNGAHPDIKVDADQRGKIAQAKKAMPVNAPPPVDHRNFFQRLFGAKPNPPPAPRAQPVPPPRGH